MTNTEILNSISSYAYKAGYELKITPSTHLKELEDELETRRKTDGFNDAFYAERLSSFKYNPSETLKNCRSIIIFAVPQPTSLLIFRINGEDHQVYIPPTYDISIDAAIENDLKEILSPQDINIERAILPLKLLAVHCGLAEYGRNNICYIPGKGSYFRFIAYYSNLSPLDETWRPVCLMDRCNRCKTCISACPTGAIDENRFLLHAELCISFHNEHGGSFPGFIDPSYHHCLFGCLKCQSICPEDRLRSAWIEQKEFFSEFEAFFILSNRPLNTMPVSTRRKLERLNIIDDYLYLSRNLHHCIKACPTHG